ncbi:MAG: Transglutaminase-like superfamily protein [Candidatus Kentron sp. G]|nr:MAG: Transglutaminase-like superfamily protein [Candidatus Kentron sp. G]
MFFDRNHLRSNKAPRAIFSGLIVFNRVFSQLSARRHLAQGRYHGKTGRSWRRRLRTGRTTTPVRCMMKQLFLMSGIRRIPSPISLFTVLLLPVLLLSSPLALAGNLDESAEIEFSSASAEPLREKAGELGSAVKIYEYVRNGFEYALYHGSRSGSVNTFLGGRGNDVDQASALIAMLRSQGIPAEYAVGTIQVSADALMNWLGVKDMDLAVSLLDDQGIQGVSKSADGAMVAFEHVWVRALAAMDNYRGAGKASAIDCATAPEECRWVELAPAFKLRQYHNQNIDIYDAVPFDYEAYYHAMANNDTARMNKNPLVQLRLSSDTTSDR